MKRILKIILLVTIICIFAASACGCAEKRGGAIVVSDRNVIHEEEFGGAYIDLTIDEFNALGFDYGDSIDISFSNGFKLEDIPYYNGYYAPIGEVLLVAYPGYPYIEVNIIYGSLWESSGLKDGDRAEITLVEKGRYLDVQEARDIHYGDDRADYPDDAVFANFRSVEAGGIRKNFLYRSASPCDNQRNRAGCVDRLAEDAGIGFILDLADTEEKILGYKEKDDFDSPYFWSLYSDGNVMPAALNADYTSDSFRKNLAAGLIAMSEHEGPYLINCSEGKDRTGFACLLLEALCGADYDEIEKDYMISYDNYYGITEETDSKRYETIIDSVFVPMVSFLTGDEKAKAEDLKTADLSTYAKDYLSEAGMTEGQIEKLRECLKESEMRTFSCTLNL